MKIKKRWIVAAGSGLYLYFLLPLTAVFFYELYHLIEIGVFYWAYSGFKFAGYYFAQWEYRLNTCIAVALAVLWLPSLFSRRRDEDSDGKGSALKSLEDSK